MATSKKEVAKKMYRKATDEDYSCLGLHKSGTHERILAEKMKHGKLRKLFGMKPKGTGQYEWVGHNEAE